jgi:uncharacterized coiled-coil protein SlyX
MKGILKKIHKLVKKEKPVLTEEEIEDFEEAIEDDDIGYGVESFAKGMLALEHKVKTQSSRLKSVDQHASEILEAIKKVDDKLDILTKRIDGFEKRRLKKR